MRTILLLTDTPSRGERLARSLSSHGPSVVVDLLDPEASHINPDPYSVKAIVSDIMFTRSAPIAGLKRHLDGFGADRPPYLCLLHEDTARARLQAQALGATCTLEAEHAASRLADALAPLLAVSAGGTRPIAEVVAHADAALSRIFDLGRTGGPVPPTLTATGAELIEGALRSSDVRAWLDVVWRFDDATHQHCLLVAGLAAGFAQHLGLRRTDSEQLTQAALLHDIGKSRIPLAILNKPARLTDAEMAIMRTHPILGDEMLRDQGYGKTMLAVVRSHHELLDGTGYPDALHDGAIPDLVRLVTICDIFGALVEQRSYKRRMNGEHAYAVLTDMGGKLDQDLVRAFHPVAEAAERVPRVSPLTSSRTRIGGGTPTET